MERTIAVWSDPSGRDGRVIPLLIENVDLPPSLRIRNWIDFRDPDRYEEAFLELIATLRDEPVRRGPRGAASHHACDGLCAGARRHHTIQRS